MLVDIQFITKTRPHQLYKKNVFTFGHVPPICSSPTETNIRFCKNVHHTYIVKPQSSSSIEAVAVKPPPSHTIGRSAGEAAQLRGSADYRQRFLRSVVRKPLYLNKNFESEPWNLIGRIADETVRSAMMAVEADIDLGESGIVRSFIQGETCDGYTM